MVNARVGRHRTWRAPEIVTSVIDDPIRTDPDGAIHGHRLMQARAITGLCVQRRMEFLADVAVLVFTHDRCKTMTPSPAAGVINTVADLGLTASLKEGTLFLIPGAGPAVDLFHDSKGYAKCAIRELVRQSVLRKLAARVNADEGGDRKDLKGISCYVDSNSATLCLRRKKSPIPAISITLFRQLATTILSGATCALDRKLHAKFVDTDTCYHDGQRHISLHLWWEC